MHIKDYRVLAILGIPLIGINHLTNLISTSPHVADRIQVDNYKDYVVDFYKNLSNTQPNNQIGASAHIEPFLNMGVDDYTQALKLVESNTLTTVLPDHTENAFWVLKQLQHLGPQSIITFEVFDLDSVYINQQRQSLLVENHIYNYRFLYQHDVVCRLFDLDKKDVFPINVKDYLQPDAEQLIKAISDIYQLDLDIELCANLHQMWFKSLTK
jgi:hypothetical protein